MNPIFLDSLRDRRVEEEPSYEPGGFLSSLLEAQRGSRRGGSQGSQGGPIQGGDAETIAKQLAARMGWTGGQWKALYELVSRESGWDEDAQNPNSTASELFQFLDSTASNYGLDPVDNPLKPQIKAGLQYILDRYGNPKKALRFHDQNNYY